jgi:hypothetical protein
LGVAHLLLLGVTHLLLLLGVSHLLLLGVAHLLLLLTVATSLWVPLTLEMDLTRWLTLISELEPFVKTSRSADSGQLHHDSSDGFVFGHIFVKDLYVKVISDVLDVECEHFIPNGGLSGVLLDLGLEFLLSVLDNAERIHLSEEFSVSCKTSLNAGELESS